MSSLPLQYDDPQDLSDNDTFLRAQRARLLESFPDKRLILTPQHREGLWKLLQPTYAECLVAQLLAKTPPAHAIRIARVYIRGLQPPTYATFSTVILRAARVPPSALPLARRFYRSVLPIVKEAFRQIREWNREKDGDGPEQGTIDLADRLTEGLKDRFPELAVTWPRLVTTNLFLNDRRDAARPYEVARSLVARLSGIGDKSQVQLERYLRAPSHASWRIPEWESPEAAALAEKLHPLPS